MSNRRSNYPRELRERAVRMVAEVDGEYPSEWIAAVASKLGIGRPGITSEERSEIRELKREVAELRRANEIAQSSVVCLRGGARPPTPILMTFIDAHKGTVRGRADLFCADRARAYDRPAHLRRRQGTPRAEVGPPRQSEIITLHYLDWFNNRRLYEENGHIPPVKLEQAYYRQHRHSA